MKVPNYLKKNIFVHATAFSAGFVQEKSDTGNKITFGACAGFSKNFKHAFDHSSVSVCFETDCSASSFAEINYYNSEIVIIDIK